MASRMTAPARVAGALFAAPPGRYDPGSIEGWAGMAESARARGRIFISYRREETAYPAGWLYDRLVDHYGEGQVFKDVDSIEPGEDFVRVLNEAVGACDVLLALIGTEWLTVANEDGTRRLDDPSDFVRLELEAALARDVRVVPVLVGGVEMPSAEELPPSLAALSRRHAIELSPAEFEFQTNRLLRVLDETLDEDEAPRRPARLPRSRRGRILVGAAVVAAVAALVPLVLALVSGGGDSKLSPVVFQDDFSTRSGGWDDAGTRGNGGRYADGAYRLYSRGAPGQHYSDGSFPRKAKSVYPLAPQNVQVEVVGRRLGGAKDAGYGISCRADPGRESYYQFSIWQDKVEIAKLTPGSGYEQLTESDLGTIDPNAENRLLAVCATDPFLGMRLVFSVNGHVVAALTDSHPLKTGTVGLVVATGGARADWIEAEFDDFVVTPAGPQT